MRLISSPYTQANFNACMALFDSNVPKYFSPHERTDFCECLNLINPTTRPYLLLSEDSHLRACGGLIVDTNTKTARMTWGMVDSNFHKQGLGTMLTKARIELACANADVSEIGLETSQHTYAFYEKFGFQISEITLNGFGDGFDCYEMVLRI